MRTSPARFAIGQIREIVARCNPDFDSARPLTWSAQGPAAKSWEEWLQSLFGPILLPHLRGVLDYAARQSAREILLLDVALNRELEPGPRQNSIAAGQTLLQRHAPRGERLITKIQDAIQAGEAFGHFATLYAMRCFAFSIPARTAIFGYLAQELAAGVQDELARAKLLEASVEPVNEFLRISSHGLNEGLRFHG
ncbi:MAG TPA: urease accessory UreF family protein [Chthoniobacterales bacterium]|nr:urease accessory UreF family protein [Chthoniobacterales bacterium]